MRVRLHGVIPAFHHAQQYYALQLHELAQPSPEAGHTSTVTCQWYEEETLLDAIRLSQEEGFAGIVKIEHWDANRGLHAVEIIS